MSATDTSLAEAHNLPFEVRCDLALKSLRKGWADVVAIIDDDMKDLRERELAAHEGQAPLSEMAKEVYRQMFDETLETARDNISQICKITWDHMLKVLPLYYGQDAVDFALTAFKREQQSN